AAGLAQIPEPPQLSEPGIVGDGEGVVDVVGLDVLDLGMFIEAADRTLDAHPRHVCMLGVGVPQGFDIRGSELGENRLPLAWARAAAGLWTDARGERVFR